MKNKQHKKKTSSDFSDKLSQALNYNHMDINRMFASIFNIVQNETLKSEERVKRTMSLFHDKSQVNKQILLMYIEEGDIKASTFRLLLNNLYNNPKNESPYPRIIKK